MGRVKAQAPLVHKPRRATWTGFLVEVELIACHSSNDIQSFEDSTKHHSICGLRHIKFHRDDDSKGQSHCRIPQK